jgi:hypothetical protein
MKLDPKVFVTPSKVRAKEAGVRGKPDASVIATVTAVAVAPAVVNVRVSLVASKANASAALIVSNV